MKYCPNCGAENYPTDRFCANCGTNITQVPVSTRRGPSDQATPQAPEGPSEPAGPPADRPGGQTGQQPTSVPPPSGWGAPPPSWPATAPGAGGSGNQAPGWSNEPYRTPIPGPQGGPFEPPKRGRSTLSVVLLTIIGVCLLVCIGTFVFSLTPYGQEQLERAGTWAADLATETAATTEAQE